MTTTEERAIELEAGERVLFLDCPCVIEVEVIEPLDRGHDDESPRLYSVKRDSGTIQAVMGWHLYRRTPEAIAMMLRDIDDEVTILGLAKRRWGDWLDSQEKADVMETVTT